MEPEKAVRVTVAANAELRVEDPSAKEQALVDRAREGDPQAFSQLVLIYQERAVHTAYSFLGNFEDARDIAQEAFVKCYRCLGSFKDESRFYTWFYRILINACKDFLRKKQVRKSIFVWFNANGDDEIGTDPVINVAEERKDSRQILMNEELGVRIRSALERLPFRQRSAFSLRYLEGLSLEEIAQSMDLSVGAVKATLWQAAKKMQGFLQGYLEFKEEGVQ